MQGNVVEAEGNRKGQQDRWLHFREWKPRDGSPRGVVVIVHGYAEHGGRYAKLAWDLCARGYMVAALDNHGHGKSEGKPVSTRRFDDYVDDVRDFVADLCKRVDLPVCVLGHSMGALITLRYVTRDHPDIVAMILSAVAASRPDNVSKLTIGMGRFMSKVAPDFGVLALDLEKISRDKSVVRAYKNDPLVHAKKMKARLGAEILDTIDAVQAELPNVRVPVLLVHGSDDEIADSENSRLVYDRIGSVDKTVRVYPGLWHEVFNEPERDQVVRETADWLEAHVKAPLATRV